MSDGDDDLPVILVSAADAGVADSVISELVDNEVACESAGRGWELNNKYYSARVCVCAASDTGEGGHTHKDVEAHLIYLAKDECSSDEVLRRRAGGVGGGDTVRLVLCECERDNTVPALRDAAGTLGYELVWWREQTLLESGPFPARRGVARAREALHAHVWPNLALHAHTRTPPAPHPPPPPPPPADDEQFSPFQSYQGADAGSADSSAQCSGSEQGEGEGEGEQEEEDEEEMLRRAELLAGALDAAGAVRAQAGAGAGAGAERVLRAELLLAAFCRALGTDMQRL